MICTKLQPKRQDYLKNNYYLKNTADALKR
jgi:hypothetical protein